MKMKIKKALGSFFVAIFVAQNVVLANTAASNIWEERRKNASSNKEQGDSPDLRMASLPSHFSNSVLPLSDASFSQTHLTSLLAPQLRNDKSSLLIPSWLQLAVAPFATINDIRLSKKSNSKTVLLLQDIHLHHEAQKNIAGLIASLGHEIESQKTSLLIGLEGADSDSIDFSKLAKYPHREPLHQVAESFMEKNILNGVEVAAVSYANSNGQTSLQYPFKVFGIENRSLYDKDVQSIRQTAGLTPEANRTLADLKEVLSQLKASRLNQQLYGFDQKNNSYEEGKLPLSNFLGYLNGVTAFQSNSLKTIYAASRIEKSLDLKKVESERNQFLSRLVEKIQKNEMEKLLGLSVLFKSGKVSGAAYYHELIQVSQQKGISLEKFPALNQYIDYVLKCDSVETSAFLSDLDAHIVSVQKALIQNRDEQLVMDLSHQFTQLQKLVDHSFSEDEWLSYQANGASGKLGALLGELKIDLPSSISSMESRWVSYEEFYKVAVLRNSVMAEKISKRLINSNSQFAVLLAGGFHSEGLKKLLEDQDLTVVTLSPKMTQVSKGASSVEILASGHLPVDQLFAGERLFIPLPVASALPSWEKLSDVILNASEAKRLGQQSSIDGLTISPDSTNKAGFKILSDGGLFSRIVRNLKNRTSVKEFLPSLSPSFVWKHDNTRDASAFTQRLIQHFGVILAPAFFMMTKGSLLSFEQTSFQGLYLAMTFLLASLYMITAHEFCLRFFSGVLGWAKLTLPENESKITFLGEPNLIPQLYKYITENSFSTYKASELYYDLAEILNHSEPLTSEETKRVREAVGVAANNSHRNLFSQADFTAVVSPIIDIKIVQDVLFKRAGKEFSPATETEYKVLEALGLKLNGVEVRLEFNYGENLAYILHQKNNSSGQEILHIRMSHSMLSSIDDRISSTDLRYLSEDWTLRSQWILSRLLLTLLLKDQGRMDLTKLLPKRFGVVIDENDFLDPNRPSMNISFGSSNPRQKFIDQAFFTLNGLREAVQKVIRNQPGQFVSAAALLGVDPGINPSTIQLSAGKVPVFETENFVSGIGEFNETGSRVSYSRQGKGWVILNTEDNGLTTTPQIMMQIPFDSSAKLTLSPSGQYAALTSEKRIRIYKENPANPTQPILVLDKQLPYGPFVLGKNSIAVSYFGEIKIFDFSQSEIVEKNYKVNQIISELKYGSDEKTLIAGQEKGALSAVDLISGKINEMKVFPATDGQTGRISQIIFDSHRNQLIVMGKHTDYPALISLDETGNLSNLRKIPTPQNGEAFFSDRSDIQLSPDGKQALFTTERGGSFVYDFESNQFQVVVRRDNYISSDLSHGIFLNNDVVLYPNSGLPTFHIRSGSQIRISGGESFEFDAVYSPDFTKMFSLKGQSGYSPSVLSKVAIKGNLPSSQKVDVVPSKPTSWWQMGRWLQKVEETSGKILAERQKKKDPKNPLPFSYLETQKLYVRSSFLHLGQNGIFDGARDAGLTEDEIITLFVNVYEEETVDTNNSPDKRARIAIRKAMLEKAPKENWWRSPITQFVAKDLDDPEGYSPSFSGSSILTVLEILAERGYLNSGWSQAKNPDHRTRYGLLDFIEHRHGIRDMAGIMAELENGGPISNEAYQAITEKRNAERAAKRKAEEAPQSSSPSKNTSKPTPSSKPGKQVQKAVVAAKKDSNKKAPSKPSKPAPKKSAPVKKIEIKKGAASSKSSAKNSKSGSKKRPASFLYYMTGNEVLGLAGVGIEWAGFIFSNLLISTYLPQDWVFPAGLLLRAVWAARHYQWMRTSGSSTQEALPMAVLHFLVFSFSNFSISPQDSLDGILKSFTDNRSLTALGVHGLFDIFVLFGSQIKSSVQQVTVSMNGRIAVRELGSSLLLWKFVGLHGEVPWAQFVRAKVSGLEKFSFGNKKAGVQSWTAYRQRLMQYYGIIIPLWITTVASLFTSWADYFAPHFGLTGSIGLIAIATSVPIFYSLHEVLLKVAPQINFAPLTIPAHQFNNETFLQGTSREIIERIKSVEFESFEERVEFVRRVHEFFVQGQFPTDMTFDDWMLISIRYNLTALQLAEPEVAAQYQTELSNYEDDSSVSIVNVLKFINPNGLTMDQALEKVLTYHMDMIQTGKAPQSASIFTQVLIDRFVADLNEPIPKLVDRYAVKFGLKTAGSLNLASWNSATPSISFSGSMNRAHASFLAHEHRNLYNAVINTNNLLQILNFGTFARHFYPFHEFTNGQTPPLEAAIKNGDYFSIGDGVYMTVVNETYRRITVFTMNEKKELLKAVEIKHPGATFGKRKVFDRSFDTARHLVNFYFAEPIAEEPYLSLALEGPINLYGKVLSFSESDPARIMVFDYEFDGNRLDNYIRSVVDSTKSLDERIEKLLPVHVKAIKVLAKIHHLGYKAGDDVGTQNYRINKDGDVRTANDFDAFSNDETTDADQHKDFQQLFSRFLMDYGIPREVLMTIHLNLDSETGKKVKLIGDTLRNTYVEEMKRLEGNHDMFLKIGALYRDAQSGMATPPQTEEEKKKESEDKERITQALLPISKIMGSKFSKAPHKVILQYGERILSQVFDGDVVIQNNLIPEYVVFRQKMYASQDLEPLLNKAGITPVTDATVEETVLTGRSETMNVIHPAASPDLVVKAYEQTIKHQNKKVTMLLLMNKETYIESLRQRSFNEDVVGRLLKLIESGQLTFVSLSDANVPSDISQQNFSGSIDGKTLSQLKLLFEVQSGLTQESRTIKDIVILSDRELSFTNMQEYLAGIQVRNLFAVPISVLDLNGKFLMMEKVIMLQA